MEDVHRIGGIPAILKYLLKHTDLIDGSQMTVTGKTLAENLEGVTELEFNKQDVVKRLDNPIKPTGHITILRGNLAPGTSVAKLTGKEGLGFEVCCVSAPFCDEGVYHGLDYRVSPDALTGSPGSIPTNVDTKNLLLRLDQFYPALEAGEIKPGTVLIFRYQGPKGAPGMPEMLGKSGGSPS